MVLSAASRLLPSMTRSTFLPSSQLEAEDRTLFPSREELTPAFRCVGSRPSVDSSGRDKGQIWAAAAGASLPLCGDMRQYRALRPYRFPGAFWLENGFRFHRRVSRMPFASNGGTALPTS